MTSFSTVQVTGSDSAAAEIGTITVDQSGTDVEHQTVVPIEAQIDTDSPASITTTPGDNEIEISPLANLVVIDVGTNDPTGALIIEGQFRAAGDWHQVNWYTQGHHHMGPRTRTFDGVTVGGEVPLDRITGATDGSRIIYVPSNSLIGIRLSVSAGTLAGVRVHQVCTPSLPPEPPAQRTFGVVTGSFAIAASPAYAAGDSIDVGQACTVANVGPRFFGSSPILRQLSIADNAGNLVDFDVVVSAAGAQTAQTDNVAFDFDTPRADRCLVRGPLVTDRDADPAPSVRSDRR